MKDLGEKFAKLPAWQKLLMLLVLWGGIGAAYYYVVYADQEEKLTADTNTLQTLTKQVNELRVKVEEKAKFEKRLQELEDERKKALTFLPDEPQTDELSIELNRRAKQSQIRVSKMAQQQEIPMGFYARVPIALNLEGTFHQLVIFFNLISEMKRIVNISDVSFTDPQRRDGQVYLRATALATTYRSLKDAPVVLRKAAASSSSQRENFDRGKKALKGKKRNKMAE